jgi:tetratricopeptide (TPR) repeat protein
MRGNIFRADNRHEEALHHFQLAAELCERSDDSSRRWTVQYNIGNVLRALGRLRESLRCMADEAAYCRERGHRWSEAITLNTMGIAYKGLGLYPKAKEVLALAVAYFDEFDDVKSKANALFDLGNVHFELKEHDLALRYFQQDFEICRSIQDDRGAAQAQIAMSRMQSHMRKPRIDEALQNIEAALASLTPEREPVDYAQALAQHGQLAHLQKRFDEANESLALALLLFQQQRDWHAEAMAHFAIGQMSMDRKRPREAVESLTQAAELLLPRDEFADRVLVFGALSRAYSATGDHDHADRRRKEADQSVLAIATA